MGGSDWMGARVALATSLGALALSAASPAPAQTTGGTKSSPATRAAVAAVAAVEARRTKALVDHDLKALDEIMDDAITIVQQSGARPTKAEFIAEQARGDIVFDLFQIEDNDIRVIGDVAVAAGSYHSISHGRPGEPVIDRRARHLRVYVNRGGAWKLIAQQATAIAVPKKP